MPHIDPPSKEVFAERLKRALNELKVSRKLESMTALAEAIGLKSSALSEIVNGRNHIPARLIEYLENTYNLNSHYIFQGNDEMFLHPAKEEGSYIPIYDIETFKGNFQMFEEPENDLIKHKVFDPLFADCQIGVTVKTDAMAPKVIPGDRVMLRRIFNVGLIPYGEMFLILTPELHFLRRIRKSKHEGHVTLLADNEKFDPVELPLDLISRLFQVKGIISRIS